MKTEIEKKIQEAKLDRQQLESSISELSAKIRIDQSKIFLINDFIDTLNNLKNKIDKKNNIK